MDRRRSRADDRFPGRREGGSFRQAFLQVVESHPDDTAQPLDAAVDRLVDPPLVLEERSPAVADAHQGEREVEPHRGPSTVELEGAAEGRDRPVVLTEPELAPADQLEEVDLLVAPRHPFVDHLAGEPVGLVDVAHPPVTRSRALPSPRARWDRARGRAGTPSRAAGSPFGPRFSRAQPRAVCTAGSKG